MKKEIGTLVASIFILIVLTTIIFFNFEQIIASKTSIQEREYDLLWTKAICNEAYCQDYEIKCKENQIVSKTPITGAMITISKDWEDPRDEFVQNKLCE